MAVKTRSRPCSTWCRERVAFLHSNAARLRVLVGMCPTHSRACSLHQANTAPSEGLTSPVLQGWLLTFHSAAQPASCARTQADAAHSTLHI
eukprot:scaffold6625_cov146-Isochrysis_galbana.AAC.2